MLEHLQRAFGIEDNVAAAAMRAALLAAEDRHSGASPSLRMLLAAVQAQQDDATPFDSTVRSRHGSFGRGGGNGSHGSNSGGASELHFFHPVVWQHGGLLACAYPGITEGPSGGRMVPREAGAYVAALRRLSGVSSGAVLATPEWDALRPLLRSDGSTLLGATAMQHMAFDRVESVLGGSSSSEAGAGDVGGTDGVSGSGSDSVGGGHGSGGGRRVLAVYAARGQPTRWQPDTKESHRRRVSVGVWVQARIKEPQMATAEDLTTDGFEARRRAAATFWRARRRVGLMIDDDAAHWFEPPAAPQARRTGEPAPPPPHPSTEAVATDDVSVFNPHLGKAGGLNFGLQAAVATLYAEGYAPPSASRPLLFAILDARHAASADLWPMALPPFFAQASYSSGGAPGAEGAPALLAFQRDVAFVQFAHAYIGVNDATDSFDMQQEFLFKGMGVMRDHAGAMTSCGSGGVWSLDIADLNELGQYFYGRSMIEDTATSAVEFLRGRSSAYVAPLVTRPAHAQPMSAVPKTGRHHVEALERWDVGAIQCLWVLGMGNSWFWLQLLAWVAALCAMLAPSFIDMQDCALLYQYFSWRSSCGLLYDNAQSDMVVDNWVKAHHDNWSPDTWTHAKQEISNCSRLTFFTLVGKNADAPELIFLATFSWLFVGAAMIAALVLPSLAPRSFNAALRRSVLFFNFIYPLNAWTEALWVAMPPWFCIPGRYPFRFEPLLAVGGLVMLRVLEWLILQALQGHGGKTGANVAISDYSLFRSRQVAVVTMPLKLRAVLKGCVCAWNDLVHARDNSFWTSFATAQSALVWVQLWLLAVVLAMLAALVGGVYNIASRGQEAAAPCILGMSLALLQLTLVAGPAWDVLRNSELRPTMRQLEVLVLMLVCAVLATYFSADGEEQ